ncbi:MAG: hypothetical protein WC030_00780 [Candidatus Paceibacterota bacterium]
MALPPNIPTSFTPHAVPAAARGFRLDFLGAFAFLAYLVLLVVITLAVGVFAYGQMLASTQASKEEELLKEEQSIDTATAENFVRLNNRLSSGKTLLANHVLFSNFFTLLESLLPATVRFSSLNIAATDSKKVTLEGTGVAKNFNALAVASESLAREGNIKNAIFSRLTVNKDNSVAFSLSADISRELISYAWRGAAPVVPAPAAEALPSAAPTVSTTTASTTTPTP